MYCKGIIIQFIIDSRMMVYDQSESSIPEVCDHIGSYFYQQKNDFTGERFFDIIKVKSVFLPRGHTCSVYFLTL